MKKRYLIIITSLIFIFVVFECFVVFSPLGEFSRFENIIQSAGIFIALLAAVIALAIADPEKKSVNVKIETSIDNVNIGMYPKNELSDNLKETYQNYPDPVKSYKVLFKITNTSGFTLEKPTLTFRLPLQKQHPRKVGQIYSGRTFNSNIFNSQQELRLLEFADTLILSNSNLPYWNYQDEITIWIRMVDDGKFEPFIVEVSVNCENADGVTKKVEIKPRELMN